MKLISVADLTFKSNAEVMAMIKEVLESLNEMEVTSPEYAATIGSLGILKRTLAARRANKPKF